MQKDNVKTLSEKLDILNDNTRKSIDVLWETNDINEELNKSRFEVLINKVNHSHSLVRNLTIETQDLKSNYKSYFLARTVCFIMAAILFSTVFFKIIFSHSSAYYFKTDRVIQICMSDFCIEINKKRF